MKSFISISLIFLGIFSSFFLITKLFRSLIYAQYAVPYGQYAGAAPVQKILVNKMVAKPGTSEFVDNLSATDPRFKPEDQVIFKIIIKNISNTNLTNITGKDFVPSFIEPIETPGSFDSATRTITFNAGNFKSGEEKVFFIKTQVVSQNQLPDDKSIFCLINKAQAFDQGVFDEDTSQFCIEKQVIGAIISQVPQEVPTAGPSLGLLFLGINAIAIILGIFLRNKHFPH